MRKKQILILICLVMLSAGIGFLAWTEFGYVWIDEWLHRPSMQLGLYAGAVAGAMTLPLVRDPLVGGRFLIGAVAGLIFVGLIQLVEFNTLIQGSGGMLSTTDAAAIREFGTETIVRLLLGVGGGALIGLFTVDAHLVILGGLLGVIVGALIGNVAHLLLSSQNIFLSTELFLFVVGLLTLSLFLIISGGPESKKGSV
jgi:hypothetical protein